MPNREDRRRLILSHCEEKEERRGRIVGEVGGEKEKRKGKGREERREGRVERKEVRRGERHFKVF